MSRYRSGANRSFQRDRQAPRFDRVKLRPLALYHWAVIHRAPENLAEIVADPLSILLRWATDRPVCVLHSGRPHARWSRWTVFGAPAAMLRRWPDRLEWEPTSWANEWTPSVFAGSVSIPVSNEDDGLETLERLIAESAREVDSTALSGSFGPGWFGSFNYSLGRVLEPRAAAKNRRRPAERWPLYEFAWCPSTLVIDRSAGLIHSAGPDGVALGDLVHPRANPRSTGKFSMDPWVPDRPRAEVEGAIERVIAHVHAGDIFQANITQRFRTRFGGSARELAIALIEASPPWYGAYFEFSADRRLISLSPELFLDLDPRSRRVLTRPIKGTAPASDDPTRLERSDKDAAELHMIVDLMRNDLGRVCEFGSVRVTESRAIESHPTVHHGVATVEGRLRPGSGVADLIRATFPPGSVTGAPKIRAMQIIDEVENYDRGPYCGAVGFLGVDGRVALNVAIRTLLLEETEASYFAGGGVVADSSPSREYDEAMDKTAVVRVFEPETADD
ncbi:MAG: anthranilate synthase component I family protein [Phycisphaerales bacterium]